MSVGRLLRRLVFELVIRQGLPCGGRSLVDGTVQVGDLGLGLCKRQRLNSRNPYIHNFSIIDGLRL